MKSKSAHLSIDMGAQIATCEWWLLPSVQMLTPHRLSGRVEWHLSIGFLCFHVWIGSPM